MNGKAYPYPSAMVDVVADQLMDELRRRIDRDGLLITMLEADGLPAGIDRIEAGGTISMVVTVAGTTIEVGRSVEVVSAWTRPTG